MGGVTAVNVARWDGSAWHAMGAGLPGTVYALWLDGSDLYAGGTFNGTAGNTIYGIAKWNGSDWVPLGKGVHKNINFPATPTVYALAGTADGLYLGGDFTHAGNKYSNQVALWTGDTFTGAPEAEGTTPREFRIDRNFPNPFNPSTTFRFEVPERSRVSLRIFDLLGRETAIVVSEDLPPGAYVRSWDASGLPSGVYFYRFDAGAFSASGKVLLVK
jgi:hypothetical protein